MVNGKLYYRLLDKEKMNQLYYCIILNLKSLYSRTMKGEFYSLKSFITVERQLLPEKIMNESYF